MAPIWRRTLVFDIGSSWNAQILNYTRQIIITNNTSSNYNNLLKWLSSGFSYYSLTIQIDVGPNNATTAAGIGETSSKASSPSQALVYKTGINALTTVSGTTTDATRIAKFFNSSGNHQFYLYLTRTDGSCWVARAKATVVLQKTGTAVTAGNKIQDTDFKITGDFGTALAHSTVAEGNPIKYGSSGTVITASYWNSAIINI